MGRTGPRMTIAAIIAIIALVRFFTSQQVNPVTGEKQRVALSTDQEIALGLQAAPELAAQHGGESRDAPRRAQVDRVGARLLQRSSAGKSPYRFQFHLLEDDRVVNAFALPGGQVFLTEAIAARMRTDAEIAGVLGHEIGHVIGRHGAEQLAKQQLIGGLGSSAVIAASDPSRPGSSEQSRHVAMLVGQMISLRFGREDELESDRLGVRFMSEAGYDPRALIHVMEVLRDLARGRRQPEFFSTHPNPERRVERIQEAIRVQFPSGVPTGLER